MNKDPEPNSPARDDDEPSRTSGTLTQECEQDEPTLPDAQDAVGEENLRRASVLKVSNNGRQSYLMKIVDHSLWSTGGGCGEL